MLRLSPLHFSLDRPLQRSLRRSLHRSSLLADIAVALFSINSSPAQAQTMEQAIEQAMRGNPEVRIAGNRREQADENLKELQAGYAPRVDLSIDAGRHQLNNIDTRRARTSDTLFPRNNLSVIMSYMLYDGHAVDNEVARGQARAEAAASGFGTTTDNVGLRAVGAYLEVLRRQETRAAAETNVTAHRQIFERIGLRLQGGAGRRPDLDEAQARLALAEINLRNEQSSLDDAIHAYRRLMGTLPGVLQRPAAPLAALPASLELARTALDRHPAILNARAEVAAAQAQERVARAALEPRLDFELSANHDSDQARALTTDYAAMLRLRVNLWRGGADTARINQAVLQIEEANENLRRVRDQLEENIGVSFNALQTAADRTEVYRRYVEAGAATREAYARQFSIGQRSLQDLLNAENEYFNAQSAYISSQYTAIAGVYRVLSAMGQLLQSVQISAPKLRG